MYSGGYFLQQEDEDLIEKMQDIPPLLGVGLIVLMIIFVAVATYAMLVFWFGPIDGRVGTKNGPPPVPDHITSTQNAKAGTNDDGWSRYRNREHNFSFRYPSEFRIINEELRFENMNWFEVEVQTHDGGGTTTFSVLQNPDGTDAFFATKRFQATTTDTGEVRVGGVVYTSDWEDVSYLEDFERYQGLSSSEVRMNGERFLFQLSAVNEDNPKEQLFKRFVSTFSTLKTEGKP